MKPAGSRGRAGHDRWLVSYADFITLLFGLFVVMYAFARSDQQKQHQVTTAIDAAFRSLGMPIGALPAEEKEPPPDAVLYDDVLAPEQVKADLERMRQELSGELAGQLAAGTVSLRMGQDGLVVSLREAGFFASGSATPKPEALPSLRRIASSLRRSAYSVRVEGHTDDQPIHTAGFDSNWELSAARATRIGRLLLEMNAVPPQRLSAAGYAEFHPVASNATEAGRSQNRRVDLIILPRTRINFAALPPLTSTGPWRRITDGDAAVEP